MIQPYTLAPDDRGDESLRKILGALFNTLQSNVEGVVSDADIEFLHDLGIVLHFEALPLQEYYVLDPYWITYGVYQILTSTRAGALKGEISMEELDYIVNEEEAKKTTYQPRQQCQ